MIKVTIFMFLVIGILLLYYYVISANKSQIQFTQADKDAISELLDNHPDLSINDLIFINESFQMNGASNDAGIGDYSGGLFAQNADAHIRIKKHKDKYEVTLAGRGDNGAYGAWAMSVVIDSRDGSWSDLIQETIEPQPEPE